MDTVKKVNKRDDTSWFFTNNLACIPHSSCKCFSSINFKFVLSFNHNLQQTFLKLRCLLMGTKLDKTFSWLFHTGTAVTCITNIHLIGPSLIKDQEKFQINKAASSNTMISLGISEIDYGSTEKRLHIQT